LTIARPSPSPCDWWIGRASSSLGAATVASGAGSTASPATCRIERVDDRRARAGVEARAAVLHAQAPAARVARRRLAPGDDDAAGARVLERIEEQVLGDPADLDRIALDVQRVGPGGLERELLRIGERPHVVAQAAQDLGGVERRDPPLLLAGLQARQHGDVVEQVAQGADVVAEQGDELVAAIGGKIAERQAVRDVGDDAEVAAQVVRRLLPQVGASLLELAHLRERALEIVDAPAASTRSSWK
jgi:hypothetical protein